LVRLVDFYGITLADLIPNAPHTAEPEVIQPADRRHVSSPAEGIDVFLLTADTERTMMPMLLDFKPGARLAEYGRHEGEEWVYVVRGRLCLRLEGAEPRHLETGDSAYYPAHRPHLFENADSKRPLQLLCVDSPPNL
jgi:quercetin dioxygenase-like cupin family protein